jgi:hypothetical protein
VSGPPTPPPGAPGYRIPSLSYRIIVGALRLIPVVILLVILPAGVLTYASSQGLSIPISVATVAVFGFTLAILGAARYILKPTRLFGPISMAISAIGILYLLVLYAASPYHLAIPGTSASIGIGFADLILLLLLVPGFTLAAGAVTTFEDLRHPAERLPFDYPA